MIGDFRPYDGSVDRKDEYERHIAPLMAAVFEACRALEIPVAAAFQYGEDGLATFMVVPHGSHQALMKMAEVLYPDQFVPEGSQVPEAKA